MKGGGVKAWQVGYDCFPPFSCAGVIYTVRAMPQPDLSEPPDMDAQPDMSSHPSSPEPENPHDTAAAALIELSLSAPQAGTNVKPGTPATVERSLADSPSSMAESSVPKASNTGEEVNKQTDVTHREAAVDEDARLVSDRQVIAAAEAAAAAQAPTELPSRPSRSLWPAPTAEKTVGRLDSASVRNPPDTATGHGLRGTSFAESSDAFPKPPGPETGKRIFLSLDMTFADIFRSTQVLCELTVDGHKWSVCGRECCERYCGASQSSTQSVRPRHSTCTRSL